MGRVTLRSMGSTNGLLRLTDTEQQMLAGERGEAIAIAMRLIAALANAGGADRLIEIESAHIDGCLYHGPVGLDFAERLAAAGGQVSVPTTLNVSALDLLHPDLIRLDSETRGRARRLMDAYVQMGCQPTWTCAPYQLPNRPARGAQIAWAESNAIVFANSVLGARTSRYGDFTDICAALTGRVPYAGLHLDESRRARTVFRLDWPNPDPLAVDELFGLIGIIVGQESGSLVPAIVGLPAETTEDQLKALGAAAASSGATAMFHAVGITPEAPTLEAALGGQQPQSEIAITPARLRAAWASLSTTDGSGTLRAVSVGTPHFSLAQFHELWRLFDGRGVHPVGRHVRVHVARHARSSPGGGHGREPDGSRRHRGRGHVHVHHAGPARRTRQHGHDRFSKVGLVRAGQPRRRRGLRLAGRLRSVRRRREGRAFASGRVGWLTAGPSGAMRTLAGRPLLAGSAAGRALVLAEPLSFWGGLDPLTGKIIDRRHPQVGQSIAASVLVMRSGRGSSSSSSVLAESLRARTGPVAVLLREPDEIVLVGAMVIQLLDGLTMPVVVLEPEAYDRITTGSAVSVDDDGRVTVTAQ